MSQAITLNVNGRKYELPVEPHWTLQFVLREKLDLTGSKRSCEDGDCGACTVLIEGTPINACMTLIMDARDKEIETIEGLEENGQLHPLQETFYENAASQCGFCTPGMIMSAKALLEHEPSPSTEQVQHALSGNLCRCTGYYKIIESVLEASEKMADRR